MNLRRHLFVPRPLVTAAFVVFGGILAYGCRRDETVAVDRNLPPETFVTQGPDLSADPQNPTDLFYKAHLYWRGEDRDGTIAGFRFAIDDTTDPASWAFTTRTDSIFRFQVAEVGSRQHLFLIRAVDNLDKQDATPDTLRFESFTECPPTVVYVTDSTIVTNSSGSFRGLDRGDTVRVNSAITFVWTGSDCDGEVVRWESIFGAEQPVQHARNDTTRTIGPLTSGKYDFLVRAVDDAGAISTSGGLFTVIANFDPKCQIDSTTIRSQLIVTWLDADPDSDAVVETDHDLTQPSAQDTIPYGATLSFCWDCTDQDGPIVTHDWSVGFVSSRTVDLCADTDSTCNFNPDSGFVICDRRVLTEQLTEVSIQVKGRDVYGRVEGHPTAVDMFLNFKPSVEIIPPGIVHANTPVQFQFTGSDVDSDPLTLEYRWWYDAEIPPGVFVTFTGQPTTEIRLFEFGSHLLFVEVKDIGDRSFVRQFAFDAIP